MLAVVKVDEKVETMVWKKAVLTGVKWVEWRAELKVLKQVAPKVALLAEPREVMLA